MKFTAEQYVDDVLSGEQVAGKWVKLACERHKKDLENGDERGLWFDEGAAKRAILFFSFLKHSKGEWAGRPIKLEPWQQFILWSLFGWMKEPTPSPSHKGGESVRRFRIGYLEVARKNGKTTMVGGIGLYLFAADGEPGAEVYSAATKRDQARLSHGEATRMVKASPQLRREITVFKDNLHIMGTASKFEPLGADANTMDGLNIHGAIIDEIHAHRTRDVWDVLQTATGARRQPLILGITTAGYDRQSLCYQLHERTRRVLELGDEIDDDGFFGMIYSLDDDDDWEDEANWIKANPNLGVSKKWDVLREDAQTAKMMPAALNNFLRLHMNLWTQASTRWVDLEKWRACGGAVDGDGLRGRLCYGGLDLSSNIDVSAFVLVFPPESEQDPYRVLCRFFIPEDQMIERVKRDRVPYDQWVRQGFITATPGDVIDYDYIFAQIQDDMEAYDVAQVAFDRWGATQITQRIQELRDDPGFLVQFGQGYASMSGPMKELERLILDGRLAHGGNPVLTWMADNLVARSDPAGNLKPDKEKSREKIDGMVALVMALARAIVNEGGGRSVYEERGLLEL